MADTHIVTFSKGGKLTIPPLFQQKLGIVEGTRIC